MFKIQQLDCYTSSYVTSLTSGAISHQYKLLLYTFKSLHGQALIYLKTLSVLINHKGLYGKKTTCWFNNHVWGHKLMMIDDLTRQLPHFGITCLVKPEIKNSMETHKIIFKTYLFRIAYYDLCNLLTLTVLRVFFKNFYIYMYHSPYF